MGVGMLELEMLEKSLFSMETHMMNLKYNKIHALRTALMYDIV